MLAFLANSGWGGCCFYYYYGYGY